MTAFVEVGVGAVEARTEAEGVIVGFDGGISAEKSQFLGIGSHLPSAPSTKERREMSSVAVALKTPAPGSMSVMAIYRQ